MTTSWIALRDGTYDARLALRRTRVTPPKYFTLHVLQFLSKWSPRRVIVACVLWLVGAPVLAAIGLILAGLITAALSGDQKIAFTAKLDNWSLAWFYVPPLLLILAWLWSKRENSAR